jgi:hypothetical protein
MISNQVNIRTVSELRLKVQYEGVPGWSFYFSVAKPSAVQLSTACSFAVGSEKRHGDSQTVHDTQFGAPPSLS